MSIVYFNTIPGAQTSIGPYCYYSLFTLAPTHQRATVELMWKRCAFTRALHDFPDHTADIEKGSGKHASETLESTNNRHTEPHILAMKRCT